MRGMANRHARNGQSVPRTHRVPQSDPRTWSPCCNYLPWRRSCCCHDCAFLSPESTNGASHAYMAPNNNVVSGHGHIHSWMVRCWAREESHESPSRHWAYDIRPRLVPNSLGLVGVQDGEGKGQVQDTYTIDGTFDLHALCCVLTGKSFTSGWDGQQLY